MATNFANEFVYQQLAKARRDAKRGSFGDFIHGMHSGALLAIEQHLSPDRFIVEGALNELHFLSKRAAGVA